MLQKLLICACFCFALSVHSSELQQVTFGSRISGDYPIFISTIYSEETDQNVEHIIDFKWVAQNDEIFTQVILETKSWDWIKFTQAGADMPDAQRNFDGFVTTFETTHLQVNLIVFGKNVEPFDYEHLKTPSVYVREETSLVNTK